MIIHRVFSYCPNMLNSTNNSQVVNYNYVLYERIGFCSFDQFSSAFFLCFSSSKKFNLRFVFDSPEIELFRRLEGKEKQNKIVLIERTPNSVTVHEPITVLINLSRYNLNRLVWYLY